MRGIEPYNKCNVVFPSSVLPSRCYGNPPSPEGEGLIGCVPPCHSGALVENSPAAETARCIYAPAYPPTVAHRREIPCNRNGTLHIRASLPAGGGSPPRNPPRQKCCPRTRASLLARGGSPPRNPLQEKREQSHTFTRVLRPVAYYRKNTTARKNGSLIRVTVSFVPDSR